MDLEFGPLGHLRDLGIGVLAARPGGGPAANRSSIDAFPASSDKIRKVGTYNTTQDRILTRLGATLMDGPAFLRQAIVRGFIMESAGLVRALQDDAALASYIRRAAFAVWHCSCSCRMRAADDPMAVTDNQGQVHGGHGIRVVDASIFPGIPCANTNLPTMIVAA